MSEVKFLKYVFYKGIFLTFLGLFLLLAPKITDLNFGLTLSISYLLYGFLKTICGFSMRHFSKFFIVDILIGLIISVTGILLFYTPYIDIMTIISFIGLYFILQSICSLAFCSRTRKIFQFWWTNCLIAFFEIFFGIIVIITLSPSALWLAGILTGLDFLLKGFIFISLNIFEEYKI